MTDTSNTAKIAARSVSVIGLNQFAQVAGGLLFVVFVPRSLGPAIYGQMAFAYALGAVFQMLGELGYQEIFSRFLPETFEKGGAGAVRSMARALFKVKLLAGLALGLLAVITARLAAEWITWTDAGLVGAAVAARIWAMGAFPILLGLGQSGRWSVENTWRQLTATVLIVWVFQSHSLTPALAALAAHEVLFLLLGLWWTRQHIAPGEVRGAPAIPIREMLRLGAVFALANLALVMLFRISPLVVQWLTGSSAEVAFFDLALGGLLLVYTLLGQIGYAFVAPLTRLELAGRHAEAEVWLGRFVRFSTVVAVLAAGGMWAVAGPLAPALFGPGFEPAAETIRAMAWGVLPLPMAWAAAMWTALDKGPHRKVRAAGVGVVAFLIAAIALAPMRSPGIALAFSMALLAYASAYGTAVARAARAAGRAWLIGLFAGSVFVMLPVLPPGSFGLQAWAIPAALYSAIVVGAGVIPIAEVKSVVRAFRRRK